MFDAIIKILPEWVLPVLIGALVWFGANFFFIAPEIGKRSIANDCPRAQMGFCQCVGAYLVSNARTDLALWTSTMGLYSVSQSVAILNARTDGVEQCQR